MLFFFFFFFAVLCSNSVSLFCNTDSTAALGAEGRNGSGEKAEVKGLVDVQRWLALPYFPLHWCGCGWAASRANNAAVTSKKKKKKKKKNLVSV